jgi:integrase
MPRKLTEDARWHEPGPQKFSDTYLRWLQAGGAPNGKEGKEFLVFEAGESGLAIRVPPNKRLRFLFQRRQEDGKTFRCPLGRYPGLSLATAQKRAEVLAGEQSAGTDLREKYPTRRARRVANAGIPTLEEAVKAWRAKKSVRLRASYLAFVEQGMFRVFKDLLPQPINTITAKKLEACWGSLEGAAAKNVASRWAHSIFNWAVREYEEHNVANPLAGRQLPEAPPSRKQHLSGELMRAVYVGARKLGKVRGGLIRFSMLTLVRRSEAVRARWSEFNRDLTEWLIPAERMKGGKNPHFVPLPPSATALLRSLSLERHAGSDLIFTLDGKTPVMGFSYTKRALDRALAEETLPNFTIHDFRRSAATWLARHKVSDVVVNLLLAHRPFGGDKVKGIYNVYDYEAERRAALELWSVFLAEEPSEPLAELSELIALPPPSRQPSAPASTPIPASINGELYEAPRRTAELAEEVREDLRRKLEFAEKEIQFADRRTYLVARVLNHPDMPALKEMVRRRKRPASRYVDRDVETVILTLTWIAVDLMQLQTNDIRRRHVEMLSDSWVDHQERCRARASRPPGRPACQGSWSARPRIVVRRESAPGRGGGEFL